MRRRTLLILALSLLLVIPAVVAVASGFDTVGSPAATADRVQEQARDCDGDCLYDSVVPERDQLRGRDQDRTNAPEDVAGDRDQVQEQKQLRIHDPATGEVGEQAQVQEQKQLRIHDPATGEDGERIQVRERVQVREETNCDGDGLQLREQIRTEAQRELKPAEPQGESNGYGPGAQDGSGPLHDGPADGAGNQFGKGDR